MRRALIALAVVGAFLLSGCSVGQSYINKAEEKLSADNVEKIFDLIITDYNALIQTADTACLVQNQKETDSNSPVMVENVATAYISTYRNLFTEYNAAQADLFKAELLGPPGYPKEIPNWEEARGATPDFCQVSSYLADLKDES